MYFSKIYQPEERPSRLSPLTEISANEYLYAGHGLLQSCVITREFILSLITLMNPNFCILVLA